MSDSDAIVDYNGVLASRPMSSVHAGYTGYSLSEPSTGFEASSSTAILIKSSIWIYHRTVGAFQNKPGSPPRLRGSGLTVTPAGLEGERYFILETPHSAEPTPSATRAGLLAKRPRGTPQCV